MKRYGNSFKYNDAKKHKAQEWRRERDGGGFKCSHCKRFVVINDIMGTVNRNHCNWCLWSKHVDESKGDRLATCGGGMKPVGLTFKHEGISRRGEIMLIHLCLPCQKISINRIARDDPEHRVVDIFNESFALSDTLRTRLSRDGIYLMVRADERELRVQLFGSTKVG